VSTSCAVSDIGTMFRTTAIRTIARGALKKADCARRRLAQRGKPASFQSASFQPFELAIDLVHQPLPCAPPSCCSTILVREASRKRFLGQLVYLPIGHFHFLRRRVSLHCQAAGQRVFDRVMACFACGGGCDSCRRASQAASMAVFKLGVSDGCSSSGDEVQMLRRLIQSSGPSCNDVRMAWSFSPRPACCDKGREPPALAGEYDDRFKNATLAAGRRRSAPRHRMFRPRRRAGPLPTAGLYRFDDFMCRQGIAAPFPAATWKTAEAEMALDGAWRSNPPFVTDSAARVSRARPQRTRPGTKRGAICRISMM